MSYSETDIKTAQTAVPLQPLLANRWSPRGFDPTKRITDDMLTALLEAARWAPSCFNEQPWRIIVGLKGEENFDNVLQTLLPANQAWCSKASLLTLLVAKNNFTLNGNANRHATYDVGQAAAMMSIQAMAMDLYMHQMAGFSVDKARESFLIPDTYTPMVVAAFGFLGLPTDLEERYQKSEASARSRKPLTDIVRKDNWAQAWE